jgi:beta-phosphoglucomutase-like phosphatase (HAD superfamily)
VPWAVLDLDGVLADARHRLHHLERSPKDWAAFFAEAVSDPVLPEGVAVAERLRDGHRVVYLTGRPERWRHDTETWLSLHGFPPGRVYMRGDQDRRPARVMKIGVLRRLAASAPVAVVVDDDVQVVRAARTAGFSVLHADWMAQQPALFDAQEVDGAT